MRGIIPLVIAFSGAVYAGGDAGGGGKAVVCRDNNHSIVSAQTLDLYEGRNIYDLYIPDIAGTPDQIVEVIKTRLLSTVDQPEFQIYPDIARVHDIFRLTGPGVVLLPVDDAAEVAVPDKCAIEQLANYIDDNLLSVQSDIWNALSNTEKAALIMHEAIYREERYWGAKDSRRSRKIVANLFANSTFEQVSSGLPLYAPACIAGDGVKMNYSFSYFPTADGKGTVLQFKVMNGLLVFSKKTTEIPFAPPWFDYVKAHSDYCGPLLDCDLAEGETTSKFESNGSVIVGYERDTADGSIRFYIKDDIGRSYINCPMN